MAKNMPGPKQKTRKKAELNTSGFCSEGFGCSFFCLLALGALSVGGAVVPKNRLLGRSFWGAL